MGDQDHRRHDLRRHRGRRQGDSGRACAPRRENCYIAAHDAKTGKELWRFYTAAGVNEPGGDTWGGAPDATRAASTWGLPGGYDPVRRLIYWGVANPTPNTRANRHGGNADAIPTAVAGRPLQQLHHCAEPGYRQAGVVLPAPAGRRLGRGLPARADAAAHGGEPGSEVREVDQPGREAGEPRDVAVMVGEGGGIFALDRGPASSVGQPVPVRHAELPDLEHRGKTGRVTSTRT